MAQQALSAEFWDVFARDYWKKQPVVFKGVLPSDLLSGMDVLETFGGFAANALGQGPKAAPVRQRGGHVRLFVEGRQIGATELIKFMPRGNGLTEYMQEVKATFDGARVGIILNDVELYNARLGGLFRELLAPLISRVGIPARNVESTIFAGDYDVTPFGIHKDDSADVLTLVIAGRKRMLVWPEAYFDEHPERLQQLQIGNDAIALFEGDATVLEAEPGDVMYWPGSAYHVATSTGGVVATCAFGFWHKANLAEMVSELVKDVLTDKLGGRNTLVQAWQPGAVPAELESAASALRELLAGGEFQAALAKAWAQRVDRLGFTAFRE
ncbi:JmjC domain-containing protein [Myxococcus sp. Y35]|uniref:JmjC domain-containing protein n=1 Tax=Pseudomyxococcus flavus TaxID=3115648 RepID=UPI003CFB2585